MDLLRSIKRAWVRYLEYQRVHDELAFSTDRQLADMGVTRGDIGRLARAHANARAAALVPEPRAAGASRERRAQAGGLRFREAAAR